MSWNEEMAAGFTLARVILDRGDHELALDRVISVVAELCDSHFGELCALAPEERRKALRNAAAALRRPLHPPSLEDMPPRARMWLAAEVPKSVGKQWLRHAPRSRRRFRPTAPLLETLRSIARGPTEEAREALAQSEIAVLKEAGCLE